MSLIKTLRSYRIGKFAIIDFVATILSVILLHYLFNYISDKSNINIRFNIINGLFLAFPIGVFAHIIFGIKTPLNDMVMDMNNHYLLKIVLIALVLLGMFYH
jgi:hypothetical protein